MEGVLKERWGLNEFVSSEKGGLLRERGVGRAFSITHLAFYFARYVTPVLDLSLTKLTPIPRLPWPSGI